jgi:hypothetical protein
MLPASLLYGLILPFLLALPAVYRLRAMRAARQRGLLSARGWRWLLAGLGAALAAVWLAQASLVFDNRPELPLAALAAVALVAAASHAGRRELHAGLRGLRRPVPRDGLDLIERETTRPPAWRRALASLKPPLTVLPALAVIGLLAAAEPGRWPGFAMLALLAPAPLLLMPWRWQWLLPLALVLPLGVLLGQSQARQASLPPGVWATPVTGARCPGAVRVAADSLRAWCVDGRANRVYAVDLASGALAGRREIDEAARVFAANGSEAWVQQIPARGLVRWQPAGGTEPQLLRVLSAHQGAADSDGRLWVIDVSRELAVFEPGQMRRSLGAGDGLLNNTANVVRAAPNGDVWVGSIGGLSHLPRGAASWQTVSRAEGVPGAVLDLAFGPGEAVWVLWHSAPGYTPQSDWGASRLLPGGDWLHLPIGTLTGLDVPRSDAALAADRHGRVWFVSQSLPLREKVLGIAEPPAPGSPPGTPPDVQLYALGRLGNTGLYAYGGSLWRDTYGVASDGAGGVLVFSGPEGGWRRWLR